MLGKQLRRLGSVLTGQRPGLANGFALQERGLPFGTPKETAALAQVMLAHFPAEEYPHLAEFTFGHVLQPGYDFGHEYEFGLDLILDGLERARRRHT